MKLIPTPWRVAPLFAAICLLSACGGASQQEKLAVVEISSSQEIAKPKVMHAPKIFMKRVTAYVAPMPEEPIEEMVARISAEQMKQSEDRILVASKEIAEKTLVESEDYIKTLAKQIVVGDDDLVRKAIAKIAKQTVLESDDDLDEAIRRISRRAVIEADPAVLEAIRKIVNLSMLEGDKAIEFTMNRIMEERFARTADDPIEIAIGKIAAKGFKPTEKRLQKYADTRYGKLEESIQANTKQQKIIVDKATEAIEKKLQIFEQNNLSGKQVRQIAENAVLDADAQIRAIALQTLAESDNYIKTVAKEAIRESDPQMQEALQEAARQVILGEDDKIEFAIRSMLKVGASASTEQTLLPPPESDIGMAVENLPAVEPQSGNMAIQQSGHRYKWIDIREYHVVVHEDSLTLDKLLKRTLKRAEPFAGKWQVKWKISEKNADILSEEFSLDAETTFESFINYLSQYILNYRGIKLTFSMFDKERILVISD